MYARQVSRRFPPTVITAGTYIVSAAFLVPLSLIERPWTALPHLTLGTVLAVLYAATLVTVSHIWFYWGIRVVSAAVASLTVNLLPFEVLALSWLLLGESGDLGPRGRAPWSSSPGSPWRPAGARPSPEPADRR